MASQNGSRHLLRSSCPLGLAPGGQGPGPPLPAPLGPPPSLPPALPASSAAPHHHRHTLGHTLGHTLRQTCSGTRSSTHTKAHTGTRAQARMLTHAVTHMLGHTHSGTHSGTRTLGQASSHTHSDSRSGTHMLGTHMLGHTPAAPRVPLQRSAPCGALHAAPSHPWDCFRLPPPAFLPLVRGPRQQGQQGCVLGRRGGGCPGSLPAHRAASASQAPPAPSCAPPPRLGDSFRKSSPTARPPSRSGWCRREQCPSRGTRASQGGGAGGEAVCTGAQDTGVPRPLPSRGPAWASQSTGGLVSPELLFGASTLYPGAVSSSLWVSSGFRKGERVGGSSF